VYFSSSSAGQDRRPARPCPGRDRRRWRPPAGGREGEQQGKEQTKSRILQAVSRTEVRGRPGDRTRRRGRQFSAAGSDLTCSASQSRNGSTAGFAAAAIRQQQVVGARIGEALRQRRHQPACAQQVGHQRLRGQRHALAVDRGTHRRLVLVEGDAARRPQVGHARHLQPCRPGQPGPALAPRPHRPAARDGPGRPACAAARPTFSAGPGSAPAGSYRRTGAAPSPARCGPAGSAPPRRSGRARGRPAGCRRKCGCRCRDGRGGNRPGAESARSWRRPGSWPASRSVRRRRAARSPPRAVRQRPLGGPPQALAGRVSARARVLRSKRRVASADSRAITCLLTADWVTNSSSAARVKLRWRAAASKARSVSSGGRSSLRIPFSSCISGPIRWSCFALPANNRRRKPPGEHHELPSHIASSLICARVGRSAPLAVRRPGCRDPRRECYRIP
jgi:hypothetical protein